MSAEYLGHVSHTDPLYEYFKYEIQPQFSNNRRVDYRVFRQNGSSDVYLYEEKYSGVKFLGKFFLTAKQPNREKAAIRMEREFHHLHFMRSLGFNHSPHYIAAPLGKNSDLNQLLVEEFCYGELMGNMLLRSLHNNDSDLLYRKLTALAYFISKFHNRTANGIGVNFNEACAYLSSLLTQLHSQTLIDWQGKQNFYHLMDNWRNRACVWEDNEVIVHGDATPGNFLFGDGLNVISFDLERLRRADRVHDVGRVSAELAHFFMLNTGDRYRAEPFIGHFLWEYACHFPDREKAFYSITARIPFYMGMNFLRIARNNYLSWPYRQRLVHEAWECFRR